MFTPPLRHWKVKSVPVAATEKFTESPTFLVAPEGWPVIVGGLLTVSVAAREVTGEPHSPLTTQS
jgi:hypothetical protein